MIHRFKNNKKRGIVEFFAYSDRKGKFVAVCLTFDIIEEGNNIQEVMQRVEEAAKLHLEIVCKNKLPDKLLNRYAPKEYWEKYFDFQKNLKASDITKLKNESASQIPFTQLFQNNLCLTNA